MKWFILFAALMAVSVLQTAHGDDVACGGNDCDDEDTDDNEECQGASCDDGDDGNDEDDENDEDENDEDENDEDENDDNENDDNKNGSNKNGGNDKNGDFKDCKDATWTIKTNADLEIDAALKCTELKKIVISWAGESAIDITLPTTTVEEDVVVEVQARSKFPLNAITFPKLEQAKNIFIYAKKAFTTSDGNATHTIASVSFPVLAEAKKIAIAYKKTHHGVLGPVNVATDSVLKKLKLEIKPRNSGNGTIGDITVGSVSEIDKVEIDTGIAVGTVSINGARADSCIAGSDAGEGVKAKSIRVVAGKGKRFGNVAAVKVFGLRSVDKVSVEAAAGNSISDVTVVGNHAGLTIKEVAVSAGSGSRLDNVVLERVISVTKSVVVEVHANVHTYNGLVIGEKRLLDKDLVLAVYKDCGDHNNDDLFWTDCLSSEAADGGDCDGGLIRASDKSCFAQGGGDACTMEVPATTTVAATTTTVAATTTTKVPTTVAAEVGAATTTAAAAAPADTTTIAPADSTTTVAAAAPADTTTVAPADPTTTVAAAAPAGTTTVADAAETTTLAGVAEPPVGDSAEPVVHDAGGDGDAGTPEEGKFVVGEAASPTASPAVEGKTGDAPEEETSGATESTGAAEPSDTGADDGATPTGPEEDEAGAAGADEVAAGANDVATSAADCNAALLETTGSLCMNGGVCEFKRANCNNADLPFDTPVCACPSVAFGTCFYGEHCQMQTSDCSADTLSCNVVKSLRSNVDPATAVCSTDEWPARLCTAAQPPALAGASSATLLEEDGIAPAKKSGAGGAVAAVLLIIFAAVLLGMYHHKRQQAVAGDGDGGSTNPMYLEPFGTKILSSVENPMYLEPVPLASPDYIAPAPVGGAEPMYEIGNVGDEPVYELGNGEGDEPLYDLGNGDGDGDGYLAVGDGVDADAMYDLAGNATESVDAEAMYDLAGNATESVDAEAMYDLAGNTQVLLNKANDSAVKETEAQRLRRLGMENGLERDAKMHTFTLEKPLRAVDDTSFDVAAAEKKRKASMKKSKKAKTPTTKKKSTTTSKKAQKSKKKKTEKEEAVLNNDFV